MLAMNLNKLFISLVNYFYIFLIKKVYGKHHYGF